MAQITPQGATTVGRRGMPVVLGDISMHQVLQDLEMYRYNWYLGEVVLLHRKVPTRCQFWPFKIKIIAYRLGSKL